MSQIRAVIIEDEPLAIDVLKELAAALADDIVIEDVANDGVSGLKLISRVEPQLIFMDIDMPQFNGIAILEKLNLTNTAIVFTTGSESYALKALKLSAVDYLLKPIDPAEFVIAIKKVRHFLSSIKKPGEKHGVSRLQLPTQQGILFIEEQNIIQIDGMGSYCRIMTAEPFDNVVVSRNIGQFEQTLSDRFFRCHNSHIINLDYVTGFSSKSGLFVILRGNISVEVSRRQKEALLSRLTGR